MAAATKRNTEPRDGSPESLIKLTLWFIKEAGGVERAKVLIDAVVALKASVEAAPVGD